MTLKWVFIDSSAFLKMYSYNYDLSENLKGILKLIEKNKIKLILTQQVLDEIKRNRESILGEFLEKLAIWKESVIKIPPFCKDLPPAGLVRKLSGNLYDKILKEAKEESLEVDQIFQDICKKSMVIPISSEMINSARERYDRGNPPGKRQVRESYGDCINWIILMEKIPQKQNLYFISADKDFSSELDKEDFSLFLSDELYKNKESKVIYYSSISEFLKEEDVKITEEQIEQEKSALPSPQPQYRVLDPNTSSSGSYIVDTNWVKAFDRTAVPVEWTKPVERKAIPVEWINASFDRATVPNELVSRVDLSGISRNITPSDLIFCSKCKIFFDKKGKKCPRCESSISS